MKSRIQFRKSMYLASLAVIGMLVFSSCQKDEEEEPMNNTPESIAKIASGNDDFSILVDALTKADLVATLDGPGTFTVFAPTNAAFESLFSDLGVSGINDLSADVLSPILLYHVLGSKVTSSMITDGYFNTLSPAVGETFNSILINTGMGVSINNSSMVSDADLMASNGVIHVIDNVLLPQNVVDFAVANDDFSILVAALVKADLVGTLNGDGPFTVFAPTNSAFMALLGELNLGGLDDLTKEQLTPILLYHVVSGNVQSGDLSTGEVPSVQGANISIDISNGVVLNDDVNVTAANIQGTNGVIHVIDRVLLPQTN
jgi:transforming growth factor-beta-induced protein